LEETEGKQGCFCQLNFFFLHDDNISRWGDNLDKNSRICLLDHEKLYLFLIFQMHGNPWQVASLQDFLYLKCPECTFDTQEEEVFEDHALQNHKLSFVFFGEIFVKDEKLNSKDDHKDPLTINGEIRDQSCVTSSENLSLAPIFPNISNIKEELIDNSEFFEKIENNAIFKRPKQRYF
jgi:hypothetical protein